MCLAASILNPLTPILNNSAKYAACLSLTLSFDVLISVKPTSHPLFRMKRSDQEPKIRSQWKSSGPNAAPGNS